MARLVANERGSTLVLVAVSMAAILAVGAISVDLSMLVRMRNEAQRAADAAALAGASAYLEIDPVNMLPNLAKVSERAFDFASRNTIGGTPVDVSEQGEPETVGSDIVITSKEVMVAAAPNASRVRVTIRRAGVGTFFARFLGRETVPISVSATAEAVPAGRSRCVMPFALPDSGYGTGDFGRQVTLNADSTGTSRRLGWPIHRTLITRVPPRGETAPG